MKEIISNERIAAARQWLEELLQLSFEPVEKEIRRREGLRFLAGFLDDLEILAKDRHQQKEAGHQDQTSFNVLAETATDGIISIDDESTVRYANPATARMFGYDLAEIVGENLTSLMPERFRGKHLTSFGRYLTSGQRQIDWRCVELVGLHKNGREFPIEVSFGEVNRNGMHFFTGIIRDVTERKRVEEALRASEQLEIRHAQHAALRADIHGAFLGGAESSLPAMLQSSTEAIVRHLGAAFARIWTLNEQENMLELQASAGQYTRLDGTHARVPLGEQKIGFIAQERTPHLTNDVLNDKRISDPEWAKREGMVAFAGYPLTVERHLVGVLAMFAREALGPGTLEALASVADTIAQAIERKIGEQKLQESEQNLRLFMETIPQMLWSATPDGAVDYWNQRVVDYTGLSADQLQSTGWINVVHPDDREMMLNAWGSAVSEGLPYQFEFRCRRAADGMYRSCLSSALPLRDQAGRILKWYGCVTDLHDWRQAQEALRSKDAELAHTTRVMTMGEITSSIAHEINQPLGAILNYGRACLRLIKTGSAELAEIADVLSAIVNDAIRASAIIARVRALSKKAPPEIATLQVSDLVADILPLIRHELSKWGTVLRTDLSSDLPSVMGDRIQLEQVLLNLVINSIDAMKKVPEDRRRLSIEARFHISEEKPFILIAVADSGVGLEPENLPKLFEAFYTTKPEGMGMGLAISRTIVEAHGGRLWAARNGDVGATFQFTLPVRPEAHPPSSG